MNDYSILFFSISMIIVFLYRIIFGIFLLCKKKYIIDEKYYIMVFYCSLVAILVLFTNWWIAGLILYALLPFVLLLYVSFAPTRKYWLVNGYELSEATFLNQLIIDNPKLKDTTYRVNHFQIIKKKSEHKTKIEFKKISFEEKEKILNGLIQVCKERVKKSNKHELITIFLYLILILILIIIIILTIFL